MRGEKGVTEAEIEVQLDQVRDLLRDLLRLLISICIHIVILLTIITGAKTLQISPRKGFVRGFLQEIPFQAFASEQKCIA